MKTFTRRTFIETLSQIGVASGLALAADVAPGAAAPSSPPVKGGTLNYAEAGDFNDFNPWGFSAVNFEMYDQVFSRLLWKDGAGKEHPDLAESWDIAADKRSIRLRMRKDARWHDGRECTAQDFVAMFGYLKDPLIGKYPGALKIQGLMAPVRDVRAADKFTLEMQFDKPVPYVTDILDYWFAVRIDDAGDPRFLKKLPVGTGPFRMTEWVSGQYAKFARAPGYYQKGLPYLDQFTFRRLAQAETLIPNLKSGTIDDVLVTSLADVAPLQSDKSYAVVPNENSGSVFNIIVNVRKPPFDKKEVRQALSYSLNRAGMARSAFFGVSRPVTSPFYSPSSLAYRADLVNAHAFDLQKAASLLERAGVRNLDVTINATPAWPQMKLFSLVWQADLAKIGVRLTVNEVENAQFYDIGGADDLRGHAVHPWINARTTRDPAIFFNTQTSYRGDEKNPYGYRNARLQKLIDDGAVETNTNRRRNLYRQANEIVVDDCFMIQVATNPRIWAQTNRLRDVAIDLNGNLSLAGAWLAK
jgi:peptide/nickel transport system substrate-binding protein